MSVQRGAVFALVLWILTSGPIALSSAADGVWPLGRSMPVTGNFGEYRDGHFHTGIDFSTGGVTGMPVYAVADGELYRVADSLTGFGKAVYLKHRDGLISVYAHLERFEGAIQRWVDDRRRRARLGFRDKLDTAVPSGEIRVRKGEVIGFSGESGAGLPHLHFELRQDEQTPIHPSSVIPVSADRSAPHFVSISFLPVTAHSSLDGSNRAVTYAFTHENGIYSIPHIPVLTGRFWIHLTVNDVSAPSDEYRVSPRQVRFSLDGGSWKTIRLDRLSYAAQENKKVGLVYDLASSSAARGLYSFRIATSLPRPTYPESDLVDVFDTRRQEQGPRRFRFESVDNHGNISEAALSVILSGSRSDEPVPAPSYPLTLSSPDGAVTCTIAAAQVYTADPIAILDTDSFRGPPESTFLPGRCYRLTPDGVPFARPVEVRMAVPPGVEIPLEKLAVYRFNALARKWSFVGSEPDRARREIAAKIDQMAVYGLFDDSVPPKIGDVAARSFKAGEELRIAVSDRGSGMADSGAVEVDGKPHGEWYYDADRGWLRVYLTRVARGKHRLAVTLSDRLGNLSRRTWLIRVK